MKLSFKSIKEKFKKEKKVVPENKLIFKRDWVIALILFLILSFLMTLVDYLIYKKVENKEFFAIESYRSVSVKTLNRSKLEETVDFFEEKEERFQNLLNQDPDYIDP